MVWIVRSSGRWRPFRRRSADNRWSAFGIRIASATGSCDADLFIVLGTSHTGTRGLIALTRKDYDTLFSVIPTDVSFVDRLIARCGPNFFWMGRPWLNEGIKRRGCF